MQKLTKITKAPKIVGKIEREGCETVYLIGEVAFLHYGEEMVKGTHVSAAYYRKVDSEQESDESIAIFDPESFVPTKNFYKKIDVEDPEEFTGGNLPKSTWKIEGYWHKVGDPYPELEFEEEFFGSDLMFTSNAGIKEQIDSQISNNRVSEGKVQYFVMQRNE